MEGLTMRAFLLFLAMSGTPVALIFAWLWIDERLAERQDRRRREQQDRQVDAEWFALLAATDDLTAVDDQLACEQMERAEGWA
jgi:hypothetical protein